MAKKTYEEQLAYLQEKKKKLLEQEKKLKEDHSKSEQKKRTKVFIEMGGIVYKILKETTPDRKIIDGDLERFTAFLRGQEKRGGYFSRAMNDFPQNPKFESDAESEKVDTYSTKSVSDETEVHENSDICITTAEPDAESSTDGNVPF